MSLRQRGFIGISQCKLETDRSRTAGVKTAIAAMSNVLKRLGAAYDAPPINLPLWWSQMIQSKA